jgi:transcriptional regulator with XRE-family HTH domain
MPAIRHWPPESESAAVPEISLPQPSAFARQLTAWREKKQWSKSQLATRMGFDPSYISHLEIGSKPPTLAVAKRCDSPEVFDLPGTFVELVEVVTGEASAAVADAEADALALHEWEYRVPGLLQVPDFARAYMRSGGWPEEKIERELKVRLDRQKVLDRLGSGWFVLDESALHHVCASRDVMLGQLEHLEAVAARPNIGLQILPYSVVDPPGSDGPLRVIEYRDKPGVFYAEGRSAGRMSDDRDGVVAAMHELSQIKAAALSVAESVAYIRRIREKL